MFVAKQKGEKWELWQILFSWVPKSLQMVVKRQSLEGKLWKPRQHIKKQRHNFTSKGPYNESYGFSSSYVQMWELDHKDGCALKNWCFQVMVQEKTLESPWTARSSNQSVLKEVNPESSLEGLMLQLKLQYFGHLIWRADSLERPWCWERLKAKREWGGRGWDG